MNKTAKTEAKRKQYTDQDSFRWSTPRVDVVSRPVDAHVRQEHKRYEEPSNIGKLAPIRPTPLPGLIKATRTTGYRGVVQGPSKVLVDDHGTQNILQFVGASMNLASSVVKAEGQMAMDGAVDEYHENRESGMSHREAMQEARPETFFGLAERNYDASMAEAHREKINQAMQDVFDDPANINLTPDSMAGEVDRVAKDFLVGTSKAYQRPLLEMVITEKEAAFKNQSNRLALKAKNETLAHQREAIPGMLRFIQAEYGGDKAAYTRSMIDEYQNQNELLGITKEETTMAFLEAQANDVLNNPRNYEGTFEETLGWVFEKDSNGVSAFSNQKVAQKFLQLEAQYGGRLQTLALEDERAEHKARMDVFDGMSDELQAAWKEGKQIDSATWEQRLKDSVGIVDYGQIRELQAMHKAMFGPKPTPDNPEIVAKYGMAFAKGLVDELPTHVELEEDFRAGKLSWETYRSYASKLTMVSTSEYTDAIKSLKKVYVDPVFDPVGRDLHGKDYLNPQQKKAAEYLLSLIEEEQETNGGVIPNPRRMGELVTGTREYMEKQPVAVYQTLTQIYDDAFMTSDQKLVEAMKFDPEYTQDMHLKALVDTRDRLAKQAKQLRQSQATQVQPPQQASSPSAATWSDDDLSSPNKFAVESLESSYNMLEGIAHNYLGGAGATQLLEFLKNMPGDAWERLSEDFHRQNAYTSQPDDNNKGD